MVKGNKTGYFLFLFICIFFIVPDSGADVLSEHMISVKDSVGATVKIKIPKRYFRPAFFMSGYTTPASPIKDKNNSLGNYSYSHYNAGYIVPLFTDTWLRRDGKTIANFHFLTGANFLQAFPDYSLIPIPYSLYKISWGARLIYNTGRKNIWFANWSPFISQDDRSFGKPRIRYGGALVFNRTVSRNFSYRAGVYRSYVLGGKIIHFPMIGFRVGPLDGTYFSLQFPKYAAFSFPMGTKFTCVFFVRPSGTIFNFSEFAGKNDVVQFRRYELLYGYMLSYRANRTLSLNIGSGFSRSRFISFAADSGSIAGNDLFQNQMNVKPTMFFTAGITVRLGRAISIHNNQNMIDAFDLNSAFDQGDNNELFDKGLPSKNESLKNIQYRDIQDLINEDDFY